MRLEVNIGGIYTIYRYFKNNEYLFSKWYSGCNMKHGNIVEFAMQNCRILIKLISLNRYLSIFYSGLKVTHK